MNDEELKKYYDAHKEEFKKEGEIGTRHILVKTQDEAKQIMAQIQKGEDFADLARKYSIDPNAKTSGGEIGFHPRGTLVPEYEAAAFKLKKVGQISPITKTQFGYHIIKLEGMKPPTYVPFEEVKDFIKQKVGQEKQKELFEKYVADLKKAAKITINEQVLKAEEKQGKTGASEKPEATQGKPEVKQEKPGEPDKKKAAPETKTPEAKQEKPATKEEGQTKK
jgi:parvulin-like peptidyl-prolyl isomerase